MRAVDLVFLLALSIYVVGGLDLAPFHADESTIIFMSRDYAYQFIDGNLDRIRYDPDAPLINQTQLRLINGTLSKTLIGLAWHSAGYTLDDLNTDWDWGGDWDYNVAANHLPSAALLSVARLPQALLMAASVWVIFALGWRLGGRGTAYLAALYLALSPPLLLNGRRAMMEAALTCFSLLTVLAAAHWIAVWRRSGRAVGAALALGAAAGLTIASKHTGVFIVGAALAACALAVVWTAWRDRRAWIGLLPLIGAGLLALAIFYLLNPAWWGADIPALVSQILDWRTSLLDGQTRAFGGYADLGARLAGWLRQVLIAQPQYFEVESWGAIPAMAEQIARYEASIWRGVALGGSWPGAVLIGLLAALGALRLLRGQAEAWDARLVVGLWTTAVALVALASPVEWQRYYLPVYPTVGLLTAHGLAWVSGRLVLMSHSEKKRT